MKHSDNILFNWMSLHMILLEESVIIRFLGQGRFMTIKIEGSFQGNWSDAIAIWEFINI